MISLSHVSRWYGQVIGLNDVTCAFQPGLTALLGPNGAGKSTMLKLITGQLRPTTGSLSVYGERPFANPRLFSRLGYVPDTEGVYTELTGREFVTMLAAMAGLAGSDIDSRTAEAIETVGMTRNADRKIGGYSKGMRQRIKVAQAIVHDPDILVLDEPLNGLDPVARRELAALLQCQADEGKTVIVSSHILYEVEQMTSQIMLLHRSRLLALGDIHEIRALIDRHPHRIAIASPQARELAKRLLDLPFVLSVRLEEASIVEVETRTPDAFYARFPEIVLEGGFKIAAFDSPDNNLESVFNYLIAG
jgi:ABC-2 type transport system ATP-binding protein